MDFDTRRAEPEDADTIAPLIYEAAPRMIDYVLGCSPAEAVLFIAFCVRGDIGFYGHSRQYVGVRDGEVFMTCTMYPSRMFARLVLSSTLAVFRHFGFIRGLKSTLRSLRVAGLFEPPTKTSLFLANLCIAEGHRGERRFESFFRSRIMGQAHTEGSESLELDVGLDNPRAARYYEGLGFEVRTTHEYRGKADVSGVSRMVMAV